MRFGRRLIWNGPALIVIVVVGLLTSGFSVRAEDSKSAREHSQTPAQQNEPVAKDEKATIANSPDATSCVVKSNNLATKTGNAPSPGEGDNRERMSTASGEAAFGETVTLQASPKAEWGRDQIHLDAETDSRDESGREKSENSSAGSDLKCTLHEAAPKTEPAQRN
jgi:hypothetical protein